MASPDPAGPVRTCVGCRRRAVQDTLVRLVMADGVLVADLSRSRPGRGAYLHRDPACLAAAVRRRAFGRALRVPAPDTAELTRSSAAWLG